MPDNLFIQGKVGWLFYHAVETMLMLFANLSVGQCGNQIGARFWDMALREHAQYNQSMLYDETMATFFRNMDET